MISDSQKSIHVDGPADRRGIRLYPNRSLATAAGRRASAPHVEDNKMEKYFSLIMVLVLALLLNQCGAPPQVEQAAKDVGTIHNTDVETYHDPETVIWWYDDTFPFTITCELRNADGMVMATQMITWTLPVYEGPAPTEPLTMTEPFSLTWTLPEPLEPGTLYEEWCSSEIDGHHGRSDPGVEYDDRHFYKANEWKAPSCWGSLFRGVAK